MAWADSKDFSPGDRLWRAFYKSPYNGNKCTGRVDPMEVEVTPEANWKNVKTGRKAKEEYRACYFETKEECLKYFYRQVEYHIDKIRSNIDYAMDHLKIAASRLPKGSKSVQKVQKDFQEYLNELN